MPDMGWGSPRRARAGGCPLPRARARAGRGTGGPRRGDVAAGLRSIRYAIYGVWAFAANVEHNLGTWIP